MSQARSTTHKSNMLESFIEQGQIMPQTALNHSSNLVETWIEPG